MAVERDAVTETEIEQLRIDTHGYARTLVELATLLKTPLKPLPKGEMGGPPVSSSSIQIDAPDACPLYSAIRISGELT